MLVDLNTERLAYLNYLLGKIFFNHDGFQNYLIFYHFFREIKLCNPTYVELTTWKLTSLSEEIIVATLYD